MKYFEAIRVALGMIWAQKMKSVFSAVGVFIGVTFLIAVVSIIQGMNRYMTEEFAGTLLGVNQFQLRRTPDFNVGNTTRETWRSWLRRPRISYDDARILEERIKTPVLTAWESDRSATIEYRGRSADGIRVIGATADYFEIREWEIELGRAFSPQEAQVGAPVVVLGKEVADGLFEGQDPIGKRVRIRDFPYRVIGVVEGQGNLFGISLDKFAVAPALSPVKRFVNPANIIDAFIVKADTPENMQAAMEEVEAIMRSVRRVRPGDENPFVLETNEGVLDFWGRINAILMTAIPALVSVSLVVGGIVIMNIMLMAVSDRTREIGIRKSLGARRKDIMRQFLVESATLSLFGAGLGITTGVLMAKIIEATTFFPASVAPWSVGVGVLLGAGVGILAGIYPASRAAKLDPVDAMRQE